MIDETFELAIAEMFAGRFTIVGDCWEFNGRREGGYGRITLGGRLRKKQVLVHRHVLALRLGRPVIHKALHTCDNPPCFRPRHLYEGDMRQNAADRAKSGHTATGVTHGKAILTEAQVLSLRADRVSGMSYSRLGAKYGIHKESARAVATYKTWRHVA